MGILSVERLRFLHQTAMELRLASERSALLAFIDPGFVAGLKVSPQPNAQLLLDLEALDGAGMLRDGTVPLETWLYNAYALTAPTARSREFHEALDEVRRACDASASGRRRGTDWDSVIGQVRAAERAHPIDARMSTAFKGGLADQSLSRDEFHSMTAEYLATRSYRDVSLSARRGPPRREFKDNREFWSAVSGHRHHESMPVSLLGFHLTEWLPMAPGLYHAPGAEEERAKVLGYVSRLLPVEEAVLIDPRLADQGILLPHQKTRMILSGVGTLRLRERQIAGETIAFLGATSTGVSHQGIPLLVRSDEYQSVIGCIKEHGGAKANVRGRLQLLASEQAPFSFGRGMYRYCVLVDEIEFAEPSSPNDILVSIAAVFLNEDRPSWTFCSFRPGEGAGSLQEASDWLRTYVRHFSRRSDPRIFGEFDEHQSHFDNPPVYQLKDLLDGRFDPAAMRNLERQLWSWEG